MEENNGKAIMSKIIQSRFSELKDMRFQVGPIMNIGHSTAKFLKTGD